MKRKKPDMGFVQRMLHLQHAGIGNLPINTPVNPGYSDTLMHMLELFRHDQSNIFKMLFFVMYDIEDNKVRTLIAHYLEKKGCVRIQKSIFLANLDANVNEQIRKDLADVQACYENHDSILIVPISSDYLLTMKVIGKSIDEDIILGTKSTLFF